MAVLVVGGAGYIGGHVTAALLDAKEHVIVFDNLSTGSLLNVLPGAIFRHGDLQAPESLQAVFREFPIESVVHLAAKKAVGQSMVDPARYARENLIGSVRLITMASEAGVRRFVFSSTAAVYGEPRFLPVTEDHPTEPTSFYGFTKLEIERTLAWFDRLIGLRYATLRYFNAAGHDLMGRLTGVEAEPENLIPRAIESLLGRRPPLQIFGEDYPTRDGTCVRDYVHVADLADAHVRALRYLRDQDSSLTVNLGSEAGATVREILDALGQAAGRPVPATPGARRPGDPAVVIASKAKAESILGWTPRNSDVPTMVESSLRVYWGL